MSLVARYLEAAGIPTVILGSALDIIEHCGVPRFVFTDFPLGNPCGKPWDSAMQTDIAQAGLDLFEQATGPRTTIRTRHRWEDDRWRSGFMAIREEDRERLQQKGEANRKLRAALQADRSQEI